MSVKQAARTATPWLIVGSVSAVAAGAFIISPDVSEWLVGGMITVWTALAVLRVIVLAGMARMVHKALVALPQSRLAPTR
jgi:hypothetical protein